MTDSGHKAFWQGNNDYVGPGAIKFVIVSAVGVSNRREERIDQVRAALFLAVFIATFIVDWSARLIAHV